MVCAIGTQFRINCADPFMQIIANIRRASMIFWTTGHCAIYFFGRGQHIFAFALAVAMNRARFWQRRLFDPEMNNFMNNAIVILIGLQLSGTAAAAQGDVNHAYKPERGPFTVKIADSVLLPFPDLDKNLSLRISYPVSTGTAESYPVVIFSHGGRCSRDRYTDFAEHWTSHGYIVIQPAHMDSSSIPPPEIRGMEMMNESVRTRRLDMRFILDAFDEIQKMVPGIDGRLDAEHVAASGHSLGGGTAMAVTGLVMEDRRGGAPFGMKDDRIDALLLITNPGNSPMMPEDPWRMISLPTFVATGTNDFSSLVRHIDKSESIFRFAEGVVVSDTPNHYLFIDDMNHYMGGLICKEINDDEPDYEAAGEINGVSTAFLDAYLKDSTLALEFLNALQMPASASPRAKLELR